MKKSNVKNVIIFQNRQKIFIIGAPKFLNLALGGGK